MNKPQQEMVAIIKIRPLSIDIPPSERDEDQHILIEMNGVSDFDVFIAVNDIVTIMRKRIIQTATKELIESGIEKPTEKEINDYIKSSIDRRDDTNNGIF